MAQQDERRLERMQAKKQLKIAMKELENIKPFNSTADVSIRLLNLIWKFIFSFFFHFVNSRINREPMNFYVNSASILHKLNIEKC